MTDPWFSLAPQSLTQDINPMTWMGNQLGFININNQASGDSQLEATIIKSVAGYGRQLGRISEVLEVVLQVLKLDDAGAQQGLSPDQRKAIGDFTTMLKDIEKLKQKAAGGEALKSEVDRLTKRVAELEAAHGNG